MAYSTTADVQIAAGGAKALRELSDTEGDNSVNQAVVASAIIEADALINTYVHKRYGVDLAEPAPPAVRILSANMAVYFMKAKRRNLLTEIDIQIQQQRVDQLEAFSNGKTSLGVDPIPTKSSYVVDKVTERSTDKAVSRAKMGDFT